MGGADSTGIFIEGSTWKITKRRDEEETNIIEEGNLSRNMKRV